MQVIKVVAKPVVVKKTTKSKRKPAAKLNDIGSELYSVLAPQHGYMKIDCGEPYFYDNLPRASASFTSYADAQAALYQAIVVAHKGLTKAQEETKILGARIGNYWVNRWTEKLELAKKAKIVKLTVSDCASN
jgi:hypothetical protein